MNSRFDGIEGLGNYSDGMAGVWDDIGQTAIDVAFPVVGAYDVASGLYNSVTGEDQPLTQTDPGPLPPPSSYAPMNAEDTGGRAAGGGASSGGYMPSVGPSSGPSSADVPSDGGTSPIVYVVGGLALLAAGWFLLKD